MGSLGVHARSAAQKFSAFVMLLTRRIIVRVARRVADSWRTAHYRCSSRRIGRRRRRNLRKCANQAAETKFNAETQSMQRDAERNHRWTRWTQISKRNLWKRGNATDVF